MWARFLLLAALPAPSATSAPQTWVAGWCANSARVRMFDGGLPAPPGDGPLQALSDPPTCAPSAPLLGPGTLTSGNLRVTAAAGGGLTFARVSDGATLLSTAASALAPLGKTDAKGNALYAGEVHFLRAAPAGEGIYGLGEHKTGRLSYADGWAWAFEDSQRRATFADNSDISLPLYTSSTGYGFLWNLPSYGSVAINATHVSWTSNSTPALDFWVSAAAPPSPAAATPYPSLAAQLVAAIGRPSDLPDFATGFWQCKLRYRSQAELLAAAQGYLDRALPLSVIVIDYLHWNAFGDWAFNQTCWPDPSAMVAQLRAQGIEVMVSVWPQVEPGSTHAPAMRAGNLLIRNATGQPWYDPSAFTKPSYLVDAFNPAARAFQWAAVEAGYLAHGIKVYWLDAAEPQGAVPGQMTFYAGEDAQVAMAYPRENARTFFEGLAQAGVASGLTLSRSAWIGSQALGGAVWSGDIFSNFTSLQQQIFIAQNVAMSGIYLWTTDIGGFHSGNIHDPSFVELIQRWFQFGVFCPLFRLHGVRNPGLPSNECGSSGGPNEIWSFGPEAEATLTAMLRLREQLREYVADAYRSAQATGVPVLRPMVFDFPDADCARATDQYLFGTAPHVVAPVYTYGSRARDVFLPALDGGRKWRYLFNASVEVEGGGWLRAFPAPLSEFPVFFPVPG